MRVEGFSHVTIRVKDLNNSLKFYCDVLGMRVRHRGSKDVYLEWGKAWVCIIERTNFEGIMKEYLGTDHIAFYISEEYFQDAVETLHNNQITIVRGPIRRGIGWTINFLDPDGTELELHTATLEQRMSVWK